MENENLVFGRFEKEEVKAFFAGALATFFLLLAVILVIPSTPRPPVQVAQVNPAPVPVEEVVGVPIPPLTPLSSSPPPAWTRAMNPPRVVVPSDESPQSSGEPKKKPVVAFQPNPSYQRKPLPSDDWVEQTLNPRD